MTTGNQNNTHQKKEKYDYVNTLLLVVDDGGWLWLVSSSTMSRKRAVNHKVNSAQLDILESIDTKLTL